ncbi:PQQ-like beta-propeller repeat protein [candidate division KSB1 bacterium]|nr:PQQ-like beta-propeller repeat protein [candidate division KSB1 bacterium]
MKKIFKWPTIFLYLIMINSMLLAKNWPQFRGPNSNCLADVKKLPVEWDSTKVVWKVKIHGRGWSSPILWDNKVFISISVFVKEMPGKKDGGQPREGQRRSDAPPYVIHRWELYCLNLDTGKELWKRVAHTGQPTINMHPQSTYASETPVTDGERVYVYFGMLGLFCYDFSGNLIWKKDLGAYKMENNWGAGASPLIDGNTLYLQIDNEENSFLVALDTKTGAERWRTQRVDKSSWSTPIIWKNSFRTELVTASKFVRSYDLKTGRQLWELDIKGGRSSASATAAGDMIYVGNEKRSDGGDVLFAVKAGASGNISLADDESSNKFVAWIQPESGIGMASPLVYQGKVYIAERKRGRVNCYDAQTGVPIYEKATMPKVKELWATPWAFDGKVFCLDDAGTTNVLDAGRKFEVIATNVIKDETWTVPAIGEGVLVIRGVDNVYCVK